MPIDLKQFEWERQPRWEDAVGFDRGGYHVAAVSTGGDPTGVVARAVEKLGTLLTLTQRLAGRFSKQENKDMQEVLEYIEHGDPTPDLLEVLKSVLVDVKTWGEIHETGPTDTIKRIYAAIAAEEQRRKKCTPTG